MWVLIVLFSVGTGGYGSGKAVNFQEFTTKERCESALKLINDKTDIRLSNWPRDGESTIREIHGNCVEK